MKRISIVLLSTMLLASTGDLVHAAEASTTPLSDVFVVSRSFQDESAMTRLGISDLAYLKTKVPGIRVILQGDHGYYYDGGFGLSFPSLMRQGHSVYFEVPKQTSDSVLGSLLTNDYDIESHGQIVPAKGVVMVDRVVHSGKVNIPLELFGGGDFPGLPKSAKELIQDFGNPKLAENVGKPGYRKSWLAANVQRAYHDPQLWLKLDQRLRLSQRFNWKRSRIVPQLIKR